MKKLSVKEVGGRCGADIIMESELKEEHQLRCLGCKKCKPSETNEALDRLMESSYESINHGWTHHEDVCKWINEINNPSETNECHCKHFSNGDRYSKGCPVHSETNEAPVESVSQLKAVDGYLKEFEDKFGCALIADTCIGLQEVVNDEIKEFISSSIESARREGVNQERERWINQPANQHDEKIRKVERQRVVEMLRKLKRTGQCTCMEDYSSCPYNIALSDVKEHLNLPSDKETI